MFTSGIIRAKACGSASDDDFRRRRRRARAEREPPSAAVIVGGQPHGAGGGTYRGLVSRRWASKKADTSHAIRFSIALAWPSRCLPPAASTPTLRHTRLSRTLLLGLVCSKTPTRCPNANTDLFWPRRGAPRAVGLRDGAHICRVRASWARRHLPGDAIASDFVALGGGRVTTELPLLRLGQNWARSIDIRRDNTPVAWIGLRFWRLFEARCKNRWSFCRWRVGIAPALPFHVRVVRCRFQPHDSDLPTDISSTTDNFHVNKCRQNVCQ